MELWKEIRLWIAGALGVISGVLGWFGWLVMIFLAAMGLDWFTGTRAAVKKGDWCSKEAREGIRHKQGAVSAVLVSGLADLLIGIVLEQLPGLKLPFDYGMMLCPMVLVWYIVTEFGSIVENVGKMGAPVPSFLRKAIRLFRETVEQRLDSAPEEEKTDGESDSTDQK